MKRQYGIVHLIIDYFQLLRGTDSLQACQNRAVEVPEITRGIKAVAKALNIPVLALSQLSRDVEKREDKRPMLADLRDAGAIEHVLMWSVSCTVRNSTEVWRTPGKRAKSGMPRSWNAIAAGRAACERWPIARK